MLEVDLLQVKNDVGHIFLNAGHGIKFVLNAVDFYRRDRESFQRGKEHATESVSDSDAIAGFQRLEFELTVEVSCFYHNHLFRFLEC